jgi:hypothetical protein
MNVPRIPQTVYSMLGPVPVVLVPDLVNSDGEPLLGKWEPEARRILLCTGVHPLTMYVTLWHECAHLALWDSGAMPSDEVEEERVADAISTYVVAAMLAEERLVVVVP